MDSSSQQNNSSITSSSAIDFSSIDTITLTSTGSSYTSDTITLDLGSSATSSYYTVTGGTGSTFISGAGITAQPISSITISDLSSDFIKLPEEWINCFPEWDRIQKMCDMYPALKIALEKFKVTYKIVQDDYDTPPNKRIKP